MRKPTRRSCSSGAPRARRSRIVTLLLAADHHGADAFDRLPDDLVIAVLAWLAAGAARPADLAAAALTCRRFWELAAHPAVLSQASPAAVAVRASRWSDPAHQFLRRCAAAGNLHACYFLGMVKFYCLGARSPGSALLARAAAHGHAPALYALAVVRFNGSGGRGKADRDPRTGVVLCAHAAWLGHLPALRELGHCLQDGYGVRRDDAAGLQLLLHAAAHELVHAGRGGGSDAGDAAEDAASRFMVEWWARPAGKYGDGGDDMDLRLCCHVSCGRRETRRHEFRRCAVCGSAIYCSRACQALDWKRAHRRRCVGMRWVAAGDAR